MAHKLLGCCFAEAIVFLNVLGEISSTAEFKHHVDIHIRRLRYGIIIEL